MTTWKDIREVLRPVAEEDPQAVYQSFCNVAWVPVESEYQTYESLPPIEDEARLGIFTMSWRAAGGQVAELLDSGDYLDWYCSGGEGEVDPKVAEAMLELVLRPVT